MGFANGTVINAANVNQHVVTVQSAQRQPRTAKAKKAAAPKPEPTDKVEVKAEEPKETAPAES